MLRSCGSLQGRTACNSSHAARCVHHGQSPRNRRKLADMNAITMLQTASILLLLTALGGLVMAVVRFARKTNPPSWIAMAHGFLAASGITLLAYVGLTERIQGEALLGLVLVLAASIGGIIMNLGHHLAGKVLPAWLLTLHIALSVIGTGLVAWSAWAD